MTSRAESAARRPELEGSFELVVARSFGRPAVTAECAARFTTLGGWLIVSEPPTEDPIERWPSGPLAELGWASRGRERQGAAFQVLEKVAETPDRVPAGGRPTGQATPVLTFHVKQGSRRGPPFLPRSDCFT